jgi:hypothetical protein
MNYENDTYHYYNGLKASDNPDPLDTSEYTLQQYKTYKNTPSIDYKYSEDMIIQDLSEYINRTYGEHYKAQDEIECFDAWIALGTASGTFRDNAMKYLWRYGKKNGSNKDDLMKALHYIMLLLHNDFYKKG